MRRVLTLHPASRCAAVTSIEVDVARPRADALLLSYQVTGKIDDLWIPPPALSARTDELWRHTCFEAFVSSPASERYFEFNFAPSVQWAAYRFDGYRTGMRIAGEIGQPHIETQRAPDRFILQAVFESGVLPAGPWRLGLAAMIEETGGQLSYWALAHAPGKPDFHRADCFMCEI
jgi:hypothetical protein